MSTHTASTSNSPSLGNILLTIAVCGAIAAAGLWYSNDSKASEPVGKNGYELGATIPDTERQTAFQASLKRGAASATWPADDKALVTAFWGELIKGDFDRAVVYSPGTTTKDLAPYRGLKPAAIVSIGDAVANAKEPNAMMVPIVVDFEHMKGKALRMAVTSLPDGRRAIHGGLTEWW